MPDTGLKRSPRFEKGAFVQLVKGLTGVVPNVIPFQYNPEKLSHTLTALESVRGRPDPARRTGADRAAL